MQTVRWNGRRISVRIEASYNDNEQLCLAPYVCPAIFVFSNKVLGTGGLCLKRDVA